MVNTDNIIPFPIQKPTTHFANLVDLAVYSVRGRLITAGYSLDCKIELSKKIHLMLSFISNR